MSGGWPAGLLNERSGFKSRAEISLEISAPMDTVVHSSFKTNTCCWWMINRCRTELANSPQC